MQTTNQKFDPAQPENLDDDTLAIELTQLEARESAGTLGDLAPRLNAVRGEFEYRHGDQ